MCRRVPNNQPRGTRARAASALQRLQQAHEGLRGGILGRIGIPQSVAGITEELGEMLVVKGAQSVGVELPEVRQSIGVAGHGREEPPSAGQGEPGTGRARGSIACEVPWEAGKFFPASQGERQSAAAPAVVVIAATGTGVVIVPATGAGVVVPSAGAGVVVVAVVALVVVAVVVIGSSRSCRRPPARLRDGPGSPSARHSADQTAWISTEVSDLDGAIDGGPGRDEEGHAGHGPLVADDLLDTCP